MLDTKKAAISALAIRGEQTVILAKFSTSLAEADLISRGNLPLLL